MNSAELSVSCVRRTTTPRRINTVGNGFLVLVSFFLISVFCSPIMAQSKPVIVQDEATVLVGIKRSLTKMESVVSDEKSAEVKKPAAQGFASRVRESNQGKVTACYRTASDSERAVSRGTQPELDLALTPNRFLLPPVDPELRALRDDPLAIARVSVTLRSSFDSWGKAAAQSTPAPHATPEPALSASELANQINNPAAPVTFVQFRNALIPNIPGTGGVTNALQIQPVIPIHKSKSLPFLQLIKMTLPIASLPSPVSKTGLGDLQFFDLVSIKQSWGRWGFGPALVFPTATSEALGAGKWQAGPSFAVIVTKVENLTMGAVFQNPVSFAGDSSRPGVNNLIITPTFTYNVPGYLFPGYWKHGWFVGLSDFNITFDWNNGGAATIPLGPQVGRVFHIGKQPFSASIEAGGTIKRPANVRNPGLILGFEFSVIFKGHRRDQ